jgi:GNAT superfamily N-acetyltransferase
MTNTAAYEITRDIARYSETDDPSHRWSLVIDGQTVSELWVDIATGEISQVETLPAHQGNGYASTLYRQAATEIDIYHAPETHRTPEGDRFARSVGGPTLDYCTAEHCYACTDTEE